MGSFVTAIQPVVAAKTEVPGPHWTEQTANKDDKAEFRRLTIEPPKQKDNSLAATPTHQSQTSVANTSSLTDSDAFGRTKVVAALEKLRNSPAERIPVAAAELMMMCYEYQFNVTAVSHAAKSIEEGVQTMTTRT